MNGEQEPQGGRPDAGGGIAGPGLDHEAMVALEELRRRFGDRWAITFTPEGLWEATALPHEPVTAASLAELRAKLLARETRRRPRGS